MHELTKNSVNVPSLNDLIHLEKLVSLFSEGGDFFSSFFPFIFAIRFLILYFNIYWILNLLLGLMSIKILHLSLYNQVKNSF